MKNIIFLPVMYMMVFPIFLLSTDSANFDWDSISKEDMDRAVERMNKTIYTKSCIAVSKRIENEEWKVAFDNKAIIIKINGKRTELNIDGEDFIYINIDEFAGKNRRVLIMTEPYESKYLISTKMRDKTHQVIYRCKEIE